MSDRVAVIGAPDREERRLALDALVRPVLVGDLRRLLDRGSAVGGKQEPRILDGNHFGKRLRELDHDAAAVAEHRRVRDTTELLAHGLVELGNSVAERAHQTDEMASK